MACKATNVCLFIVLFAFLWNGSLAQSSCTSSLMGLSPCLNYVSGNTSTPSSSCCSRLSGVVQSQPKCLCLLLNGTASSYGFDINQTLALQLPGACSVQTPPASTCNATTNNEPSSPVADRSPPASSTAAPSGSIIPGGSKAVPSPNAGSYTKAPRNAKIFIALVVAGALLSGGGF